MPSRFERRELALRSREAGRRRAESARGPEELIATAKRRWTPIKTYCLFSGGADSGVLAHRCREHYDALLYIDTGTAIPSTENPAITGVEDHVRAFAEWLGKPVVIRRSGEAYRTMVLGDRLWWQRFTAAAATSPGLTIEAMIAADRAAGRTASRRYGQAPFGFPGPGQHGKAYSRLKERRLEDVLRETKEGHPRSAAVLFLSGVRRNESRRRARREPLSQRGSAKFCNSLIDWSAADVASYRRHHQLPVSEVAAILHRSGECNCGSFARAEEERTLMQAFWPRWWSETIEALEAEAEARGVRWCRWGGYDRDGNQAAGSAAPPGLLCSSCQLRDGIPARCGRRGRGAGAVARSHFAPISACRSDFDWPFDWLFDGPFAINRRRSGARPLAISDCGGRDLPTSPRYLEGHS